MPVGEGLWVAVGDGAAGQGGAGQAGVAADDRRRCGGWGAGSVIGVLLRGASRDGAGWARDGPAHDDVGGGGEAVHARVVDPVVGGGAPVLGKHEPHLRQHLQMSGDGGLADVDGGDDLADVHRGLARRASSETIWILVGSASALNQLAYSAAVTRSRAVVHLSSLVDDNR